MWPFRKNTTSADIPPAGLDDLHSFVKPASGSYPWVGAAPDWSPRAATTEFPTVAGQQSALVHYDRSPADENPAAYWQARNSSRLARGTVEQLTGHQFDATGGSGLHRAPDPRWNPPLPSRAMPSPSQYRFSRPFDQRFPHRLNGVHSSMADMRRSYAVGGMNPIRRGRNTYRLEPPTRDISSADYPSTTTPESTPMSYVAPVSTFSGSAYRLSS